MIVEGPGVHKPRVCLVTDHSDWATGCVRALGVEGFAPETVGWGEADDLRPPLAAVAAHVADEPGDRVRTLEVWAERALQPCTAVLLAPARRSALVANALPRLGFVRVDNLSDETCPREELTSRLRPVAERGLWVAGAFARELENMEPMVVRAFTRALDGPAPARRVVDWATRCWRDSLLRSETGIGTRHDLVRFLGRRDLPPPGRILRALGICCVLDYARRRRRATRRAPAERFDHPSADAFGRKVKRLTGRALGELRETEPEVLVRLLVRRIGGG